MEKIRLIIFDLDGTLIDAYPAIIESFNYTMRKLNYPPKSRRVIRRAVGWGDENLLKPFIKKKDLRKALLIYRWHHKTALLRGARLFPDVARMLACLKTKGYKLAIASNRPSRFSWILIRGLGLKKYFHYVLCGDRLKHGKPHPEILQKIMEKFSLKPEQTIYVGDMTVDAQAGMRAGVETIVVTTGSSSRRELKAERPYRIIPRVSQLLEIF